MKKTVHFVAIGALLAGILFKIMHWPGASALIVVGSMINLVSGILHHGEGKAEGDSGTPYLLLTATLGWTIVATLFKTMHWTGADFIGLVSIIITLVALLVLATRKVNVSSSYVSSYLLAMFTIFTLMKNNPLANAIRGGNETEETTVEHTEDTSAAPTMDSAANP